MAAIHHRGLAIVAVVALLAVVPVAGSSPAQADPVAELHSGAMVDTSTGIWYVRDPLRGAATFFYGDPGDLPFLGDWDCDGDETPGLYRFTDGFAYLRNSNTQGNADITFFFGDPGDLPLAGDFNGDGCDTLSVYRPATSEVFIINELGADGGGLGAADFSFVFGDPGDAPFVGDFDGDGIDTIGLHRRTTGEVYFRNSLTAGNADFFYFYGDPGDNMMAGDWDGDGVDTLGVFRPAGFQLLFRNTNTPGFADGWWHFRDAARRPAAAGPNAWADVVGLAGATGFPGEVLFSEYPCPASYVDPFTTIGTSPTPSAPSDADGVLGLAQITSGPCDRFVITLGSFGSFGATGAPANTVPAGITVENFGHRNHVTMPGIEFFTDEYGIDHKEGIDHFNGPYGFVVFDPDNRPFLYVDVHHGNNRATSLTLLSDPARIVLDTVSSPTGTGLAIGPIVSDDSVIRANLDPDLLDPGIRPPFEVVGYGRFFEATGQVILRESAAVPGTGAPATATFSGTDFLGTVTGSDYAIVGGGDFLWGEFRFTIEDIAPGEYELQVVSDGIDPSDGGVFDEFLVVP